jgi:hypothetical protein
MPKGVPSAKQEESRVDSPVVEPEAGRREKFEATRPDGTVVIVDRNIDTGEQTVTDK